jgi:REP element-mobilizing transposase RayT
MNHTSMQETNNETPSRQTPSPFHPLQVRARRAVPVPLPAGAYFVTVRTRNRECLFGEIVDEVMRLNKHGMAVQEEWLKTAELRENVEMGACTVMPNHLHGVVVVTDGRGTARRAPTEGFSKPVADSIPTIMRAFKSASTKRINELRHTPGTSVWQRNYYEHVIRNEDELKAIREYILGNPARWNEDENNPVQTDCGRSQTKATPWST